MGLILRALRELHGGVAVALVFLVPLLEASTLVGLVFPGELAVLTAGVLVYYGKLPLWLAIVSGIAGAVIGDSIGYFVGKRYGERIRRSRLGRFVGAERWKNADQHLHEHGVVDIVFARFPPLIRTLVPGAAGMAKVPYGKFLVANVVGGSVWIVASVLVGMLAGRAWPALEKAERWITIGAAVAALVFVVVLWRKRRAKRR